MFANPTKHYLFLVDVEVGWKGFGAAVGTFAIEAGSEKQAANIVENACKDASVGMFPFLERLIIVNGEELPPKRPDLFKVLSVKRGYTIGNQHLMEERVGVG